MAKKKKTASHTRAPGRRVQLIVTDDPKPAVTVEPGTVLEVVSVALVTPSMSPAGPLGARLCGGTSTCLALISTQG